MSNKPVSGNYQLAILDLLSNVEQTTIDGRAEVAEAQ
jgi:hypothetical protein